MDLIMKQFFIGVDIHFYDGDIGFYVSKFEYRRNDEGYEKMFLIKVLWHRKYFILVYLDFPKILNFLKRPHHLPFF